MLTGRGMTASDKTAQPSRLSGSTQGVAALTKLTGSADDLGDNARLASITLRNTALADALDPANAARMAPWTERGLPFAARHALSESL